MIVDANVLISALVGRSLPDLLRLRETGISLGTPLHQLRETRQVLRHRFGLDETTVENRIDRLRPIVVPIEPLVYSSEETGARRRLSAAAQSDWPVLAAALALDEPVLTNDRDFFGVGVTVWSPGVLKGELEAMNA